MGDIADAYMYYDEMVAERKAQGREVEGRYRQHSQSNHEGLEPSDDECERYDPEDHDEQCDEYGDQSGDPETTFMPHHTKCFAHSLFDVKTARSESIWH